MKEKINLLVDKHVQGLLTSIELKEQLLNMYVTHNPTLKYDQGKNAGEIAKEHNITVGELGCKNCGCVTKGGIFGNKCSLCGTKFFE